MELRLSYFVRCERGLERITIDERITIGFAERECSIYACMFGDRGVSFSERERIGHYSCDTFNTGSHRHDIRIPVINHERTVFDYFVEFDQCHFMHRHRLHCFRDERNRIGLPDSDYYVLTLMYGDRRIDISKRERNRCCGFSAGSDRHDLRISVVNHERAIVDYHMELD